MKCPVTTLTKALQRLKQYAGLPVPFMVADEPGGVPDFRVMDPAKVVRCVTERLCGICGEKLGTTCWYVGGPKSYAQGMFTDPPMHHSCAKASIELCPFLNGKRTDHRQGGLRQPVAINTIMQTGRPEQMYLMSGRTSEIHIVRLGNSGAIGSGPLELAETF